MGGVFPHTFSHLPQPLASCISLLLLASASCFLLLAFASCVWVMHPPAFCPTSVQPPASASSAPLILLFSLLPTSVGTTCFYVGHLGCIEF